MAKALKLNAKEVLRALNAEYTPDKWALFPEARTGTGFGKDSSNYLDAWTISYVKCNTSISFEIKVSRSDFASELKKPLKRRAGMRLSHEFYFVVPKGLVSIEEVPVDCGLIEVDEFDKLHYTIPAPRREIEPPTWSFMAQMLRQYDKDRLSMWHKLLDVDLENAAYRGIAIREIDKMIDDLHNFTHGSKEVPDIVRKELERLRANIIENVELNKLLS